MAEITDIVGQVIRSDKESEVERSVAELKARVADRVRKARERKGIPRRVLSDMSGVSQRYLAQLEAGDGNISIGLLERVAMALDHRIEWLVGAEDPWNSEAMRVADMFRVATRATKDAALAVLQPQSSETARAHRICLIGLRGAGKSTLGAKAAERLGVPFLELNKEIEEAGGMPVSEIMALYGQEGYRSLELGALDRVVARHDTVLMAAAGGVVAEPVAFKKLLANFNTIWVKASAQEHMDRVRAQGDERPMAGNPEAMEQLKSILTSREALYSRAQTQLDTSGEALDVSLERLLDLVETNGFLA